MSMALLVLGWPIRRWQRGQRPELNSLLAARVVLLAKAAQWVGSGLTGWYLALALSVIDTLDIAARRSGAMRALVAGLLAVLLWVVGALVERWCRLNAGDPPDPRLVVGSQ